MGDADINYVVCWLISFFIPPIIYMFIEGALQGFSPNSARARYKESEKPGKTTDLYLAVVITCIFASLNTLLWHFIAQYV